MEATYNAGSGSRTPPLGALAVLVAAAVLLLVVFREGLREMVGYWNMPEYQHGFLIPFVSLYLVWAKAQELHSAGTAPSWAGLAVVLAGMGGFLLGELSALFVLIEYAFLVTLFGLVWTAIGWRGFRIIWAGLVYLAFMVPLPTFFRFNLSNIFQLWSSDIGAAFLRLIGISVYLEGNVIDLGVYKLQVVEACSGLRYLFPLMSFAFFCAYIFRGRFWQKAVIFLSSVPITILMNSFRIAVTGVLVNRFGTSQAEGFLHYFEGWIIFVACIALLFLEMAAFALLSGRRLAEVFEVEIPAAGDFRLLLGSGRVPAPLLVALACMTVGAVGSVALRDREEIIPVRQALRSFPLLIGEWEGRDDALDRDVLEQLNLTDYLLSSYTNRAGGLPADLYVAYYESQRKGASVHSPRACLPGGGWQMADFDQYRIDGALPDGSPLMVNRAIITKGSAKAIVYYWFMQRGRYLTNEYLVKWYIFWDSLTMHRTDGAMVRVTVPVPDGVPVEQAAEVAEKFIRAVEPKLYYFIPQGPAAPAR